MTCNQLENFVSEYVDGTLDPASRRGCAEHLIECRVCRLLVDDVRAAVHLCHRAGWVKPSTDLDPSILQATAAGRVMQCSVFDSLILTYTEGFIGASEFHVFQSHFKTCARCQRLLAGIQMARELCQDAAIVNVPPGLHDRILSTTSGTNRRKDESEAQEQQGRVHMWLSSQLRKWLRPLWLPELVPAALLLTATLGLLLVEVSDDMTLGGIYRQARSRLEELVRDEPRHAVRQDGLTANLQGVKTRLGSVVGEGLLLFSRNPDIAGDTSSEAPSGDRRAKEASLEGVERPADAEDGSGKP